MACYFLLCWFSHCSCNLEFCWHVHSIFLFFCHMLCWLAFWCEVVVLGWSFPVLFPCLFSSSLVASAVQGVSFLCMLCMSVFGAAVAIFLARLLLYCCLLHVLWFFTKFFLHVLFFRVLFCCLVTFMLCFWLSLLTNNFGVWSLDATWYSLCHYVNTEMKWCCMCS